jgi:hypothetical protein
VTQDQTIRNCLKKGFKALWLKLSRHRIPEESSALSTNRFKNPWNSAMQHRFWRCSTGFCFYPYEFGDRG